jgi:hypothetical protein
MVRIVRIAVLVSIFGCARTARPCDVISMGRPQTAEDYVHSADVIVRVIAKSYVSTPAGPSYTPQGEPTPRVAFAVVEVLKGGGVGAELTLPAFLSDRDDFNSGSVPYAIARPASHGPCYADWYRAEGEFLLLLRKAPTGFSVRWSALAPLNEQLRGEADPWLTWVRNQLK